MSKNKSDTSLQKETYRFKKNGNVQLKTQIILTPE